MPADLVLIIPAYNEEKAIGQVVDGFLRAGVEAIVVVDNNSTDATAAQARKHGATVVSEPKPGYGMACLRGMEAIKMFDPQIVIFADGDASDDPLDLPALLAPLLNQQADLVIGSRALGNPETGSMTVPQRFGNWLATRLMRWLYGYQFTDLGPFRAIRYSSLLALNMEDTNYGWTIEMQLKAGRAGLRYTEVPVAYKRRIGKSKISGTVKGTLLAGYTILYTLFKFRK